MGANVIDSLIVTLGLDPSKFGRGVTKAEAHEIVDRAMARMVH